MFGLKKRAIERRQKKDADMADAWAKVNYHLPLQVYYVDGKPIEAAGYEIVDGALIFYVGYSYGRPAIAAGACVLSSWRAEEHQTICIFAADTWKRVDVEADAVSS